ncbi:ABC transporter substrate-binding protein [Streptomyces sp. CB02923]|uniref:ABC transporter permease n=1 Tax=Streptomyces sp. CB02923 TaxID=1718985 RepID=UPI00093E6DAA|nr:ABC transporter permease [Streptomyces sp. CB02923]OKI01149.1 ABC transporter substrate-binding protein [Streptomyces sp. CB02923]
MFVAWRDLRFAKGRFALMGTVIVLITVLVGLLSGLTAGLGRENTSAITSLPADRLAFTAPADGGAGVSFTDSRVGQRTWESWARVPGVESAEPLGIGTARASAGGGAEERTAALSAFGVRPGSHLAPAAGRIADGSAVLSAKAADELGVRAGGRFTLNGRTLTAAGVAGEAMYSHTPVVWTSLDDWAAVSGGTASGAADSGNAGPRSGGSGASRARTATVVALTTSSDAGLAAADRQLGTRTVTTGEALNAIGSYTAENGSLQLMRGFLFAISALVIGAFFTVWTIQRSGDVAVLKALGAPTGYLLRDALGQAVVLLVIGTGVGTALAASVGAAVGGTVPFVLDPATVLVPALVMIALGAVGAALSIRRITAVDPLTALGSAR